jgi:hypothetical protein
MVTSTHHDNILLAAEADKSLQDVTLADARLSRNLPSEEAVRIFDNSCMSLELVELLHEVSGEYTFHH